MLAYIKINNIKTSKFKLKSSIPKNRILENESNVSKYTGYSNKINSQSNVSDKRLWSNTPTTQKYGTQNHNAVIHGYSKHY